MNQPEGGAMCEIAEPDDYCAVWKWTEHKARKRHRCDACLGAIAPGERYSTLKSLFEGEWSQANMCQACVEAAEAFEAAHGDVSLSPSGFRDALGDCLSEEDAESKRWEPVLEAMNARQKAAEATL